MTRMRISLGVGLMVAAAAMLGGCDGSTRDASSATGAPNSGAVAQKKPSFEMLVIPSGTNVVATLSTSLSTDLNHAGDPFTASVNGPIVVDGRTVMPSGSKIQGVLLDVVASGRVKGRARMTLQYHSIVDSQGRRYSISAVPLQLQAASDAQTDAEILAAGTILGAVVGGVAGGGKGAAIGAGAGAVAGTIVILATKGDDLALSPGQQLSVLTTAATSVQVAAR